MKLHLQSLGKRGQLVIHHRSPARLHFSDLGPSQHHAISGHSPTQVLLRDARPGAASQLLQSAANQITGVGWSVADQGVPLGHVDRTTNLIRKGASRAHFQQSSP